MKDASLNNGVRRFHLSDRFERVMDKNCVNKSSYFYKKAASKSKPALVRDLDTANG